MAVSFLITTRLSMPVILVALATVAIVGGSLWVVILVLGFLKWDRYAVCHAQRHAAGAGHWNTWRRRRPRVRPTWRIVWGEVLPNVVPQLIVIATLEAASAILLEASLSFLGLGVQPPAAVVGPDDLGSQGLYVLLVLAHLPTHIPAPPKVPRCPARIESA